MVISRGIVVCLETLLPSTEGSSGIIVGKGGRFEFGSRRFQRRSRSGNSCSGRGDSSGASSSMSFMEHREYIRGAFLKGFHELLDLFCMITCLGILDANEVFRDIEQSMSMFFPAF